MKATPMLARTPYLDSHDEEQAEKVDGSTCTLPCPAMAAKGIAESNGWPVSRADAPAQGFHGSLRPPMHISVKPDFRTRLPYLDW